MKKILLFVSIIAAVTLAGCSKDDDSSRKFPKEVKEVLAVLNGKFYSEQSIGGKVYQTTTFVFYPFGKPTPKKNPRNEVPLNFDGKFAYKYTYGDMEFAYDCYFYIDTENKQITAFETTEEDEYYDFSVMYEYNYEIIDANTFDLSSVGSGIFGWKTFKRQ